MGTAEEGEKSVKAEELRDKDWGGEEEEDSGIDPNAPWFEKKNKSYNFIGLRGRMVVIPQFMFSLYQADGGRTVVSPQIGVEYGHRRNGFEYDAWLAYAAYTMEESPFKADSDPDVAWERVSSSIKTVTLGLDFMWSTDLDSGFSFMYGIGAGLGVVFGSLRRNQAYPPSGVASDPETYVKCPAQGVPDAAYCAADNDHYGDYTEPNWFDGGSKPVVFPWIALPQIGFRFKPSKQVAMRFDTGLSFPGPFFFGLSGQYGLL